MSGGYTPLFGSLTTGTLCGRWPDIGLWPIVLSMSDKHGMVDVTPAYIASVTGLPIDDVVACMDRFCQPDPYSRTADCDGRRLELVAPDDRPWGWRIVNHGKYREKARLAAKNAEAVASGREAERKRHARAGGECPPVSAGDRRLPPLSDPSDADADSDSDSEKKLRPRSAARADDLSGIRERFPKRIGSNPWPRAEKAIRARLKEGSSLEELQQGVERYRKFCEGTGKAGTEYVMQAATFFGPDRRFLEPWDLPPSRAKRTQDANVAASLAWLEAAP